MLTKTELRKVRKKMYVEKINGTKLSNLLNISNTSLSFVLNGKKDLPFVEQLVKDWLKNV